MKKWLARNLHHQWRSTPIWQGKKIALWENWKTNFGKILSIFRNWSGICETESWNYISGLPIRAIKPGINASFCILKSNVLYIFMSNTPFWDLGLLIAKNIHTWHDDANNLWVFKKNRIASIICQAPLKINFDEIFDCNASTFVRSNKEFRIEQVDDMALRIFVWYGVKISEILIYFRRK